MTNLSLDEVIGTIPDKYKPKQNLKSEDWVTIKEKIIPKDSYQVSSYGRIRSLDRLITRKNQKPYKIKGRIMRYSISNSGYKFVSLTSNHVKLYIHRLVAKHFIGKLERVKREVNHKDGNKLNNNLENLEIISNSENKIHSHRVLGNKAWNIRLTKEIADSIREEYRNTETTQRKLAEKHGVSTMVINRIINNVQREYI